MSDSIATNKDSRSCCGWKLLAALLFLRLCVGWHFFSEGIKKVSYDRGNDIWSMKVPTEFIFGQARGPLASFYHSFLPGEHNWRDKLAVSNQLTPGSGEKLASWVSSYVKRRQSELKSGRATEVDIPEFVPCVAWYAEIDTDRRQLQKRFVDLDTLSEEQRSKAAEVFQRHDLQLADYLIGESIDMQVYQHELWRLENMQQVPGATEVPFLDKRLATKAAETSRDPLKWVAAVKKFDKQFVLALRSILSEEQKNVLVVQKVDQALTSPKAARLRWMNLAATTLTIGVGLCLLIGLFTRLASVAGALFLLSIMATQPPWVAGADTKFFYYQLVEFAALVFLAAVAAGRVAGLDFIFHGIWTKCCGRKSA